MTNNMIEYLEENGISHATSNGVNYITFENVLYTLTYTNDVYIIKENNNIALSRYHVGSYLPRYAFKYIDNKGFVEWIKGFHNDYLKALENMRITTERRNNLIEDLGISDKMDVSYDDFKGLCYLTSKPNTKLNMKATLKGADIIEIKIDEVFTSVEQNKDIFNTFKKLL